MKMWHKRQIFSLVWVETVVACHASLGYIVTGAPLATQNFRFRMCLNFSKTSGGGRAARPGDVLPLPQSIQLTTGDSQNKFPPRSFEACNYVFRSTTRRGLVRDIIRFRASFTWHYDKLKGSSEMELTLYIIHFAIMLGQYSISCIMAWTGLWACLSCASDNSDMVTVSEIWGEIMRQGESFMEVITGHSPRDNWPCWWWGCS